LTDTGTGLPDGLFSNQKSKFGFILEGLVMEEVAMFYGHLVRFTVFCYILWTFGVVRGILVYFSVLVFRTKKNLATMYWHVLHLYPCGSLKWFYTFR
jgi:hypothetical protein